MASLFVPEKERESLLAVYALNVELGRIPTLVSEEIIGHVRQAWWQEAIDELYTGHTPRGQPVLQALAVIIPSGALPHEVLMKLVDAWRENYPNVPPNLAAIMEPIHLALLSPAALAGWHKARNIIAKHRRRFGARMNGWLSIKLLLAGW